MKYFLLCLSVSVALASCSGKKKYFTADIKFRCTDIGFFDTLSTVLFTSNDGDLGGKPGGYNELFSPERVYKKNVPKINGHFYVDSIERTQYWILLIECFMMKDILYTGFDRNVDFSKVEDDTVEIEFCMQANMTIRQN